MIYALLGINNPLISVFLHSFLSIIQACILIEQLFVFDYLFEIKYEEISGDEDWPFFSYCM